MLVFAVLFPAEGPQKGCSEKGLFEAFKTDFSFIFKEIRSLTAFGFIFSNVYQIVNFGGYNQKPAFTCDLFPSLPIRINGRCIEKGVNPWLFRSRSQKPLAIST
ncbi:MAG TPA: hypothetical protein VI685_12825 [Candidatus Angelobacter sp.]